MSVAPAVFEVGDEDFAEQVLSASSQTPIAVDFWAPWCGPCRNLGPLIEGLAESAGGSWRLAKVNVDESPQVAAQFGVRSIPLVLGFRDGQVVSEFVGAQPEGVIREFLAKMLPSAADELVAEARDLLLGGQPEAAEPRLRAALEAEPRHGGALLTLAPILAEQGQVEEALELLEEVSGSPELEQEAQRFAAAIRTEAGSGEAAADLSELRARTAAHPDDLAGKLELGRALAAQREYEAAFEELLAVVERDKDFADEGARKTMLDLFELLGGEHDLTQTYRSRLAQLLFR